MPEFDKSKCAQRRRLAAKREGVEAVPVQLMPLTEALAAKSGIPASDAAILAAIRAQQPEGATPLASDEIFAHVMEAANAGFIPSRNLFLGPQTLQNVARKGMQGIAFMNSHRTGGMSHPSELPFGKTFAGHYDAEQGRAMLGVYMLAKLPDGTPVRPNGAAGPSTAELDAMIRAGTIGDVSVGLRGGQATCDVCGADLMEADEDAAFACPHVPGTTYRMSAKEQSAQKKRGVPTGCATYTLENAVFGEVSAVFDGAVPGAGFRKALLFAREGTLPVEALAECRSAYATVLSRGEFSEGRLTVEAAQELADGLLSLWDGEEGSGLVVHSGSTHQDFTATDNTVVVDVEPEPASASFEAQLTQALAVSESCVDRAEGYRNISAGRVAQLEQLHARLGKVLTDHRRPEQARSLSLRALRLRAAQLARPGGTS